MVDYKNIRTEGFTGTLAASMSRYIMPKVFGDKFNLSAEAYGLLCCYTAQWSGMFNNSSKTSVLEIVKIIDKGLSKLPSFNNKIVFRTEYIDDRGKVEAIVNSYKLNIGTCIRIPSLLSTSKHSANNEFFVIEINTSSKSKGYDLEEIGIVTSEAEVLFSTNSIFCIKRVKDNYVLLDEVIQSDSDIKPLSTLYDIVS